MEQTIIINITGKVQGVYFRQSTSEQAIQLGLTGTVRNLPGGSVEVIATGDSPHLQKLVDWCRIGPRRAQVEEVTTQIIPVQTFDSFRIVR